MPLTNYITFRVRGIPAGTTIEGLEVLVAQAVSCQDASGVRVRSLAVDASRPREMVATVTFANIPEELSNECGYWTIEGPQDITLVIDTHFHGCTTLYCPPVDEWRYDLIAISGLNGHAFGSFKKKNSSYMWLRDSLPRDLPGCRVIIYGYDTRLQDSRSFQSLLDIGKKFQTAVRQVRQNAKRSLVFLGHSLGGIVIKEAISLLRASSIDADKLTFAAIRGVIFFGVPNQGMDIQSLIPMVGDQANRGFLHTLDHNSPVLRTLVRSFCAALGDLRCEILNFYETQESPTALQNDNGTWSMSGPPAVLVDTYSATHGRPDDSRHHRVYPIDCNHSSLIEFGSAHEEPYVLLVAFLQEIDTCGACSGMTMTEEACYQSLGFREQHHRMDALEPCRGTCDWLTTHELFIEWLQSSKGFLRICGNPGSGKSMAMKHALKHVKRSTSGVVASFFIHGQGTDLQKTPLGIYRSLLHQIYPYDPESFSNLTMRFQDYTREAGEEKQDEKWSWMQGEIRQNFLEGLQKFCRKTHVIILMDALDESGEDQAKEIFKDLETLFGLLRDDSAGRLSLCVSCRPYPDISFNSGKTIAIDDLNSLDIRHVVNLRLDFEDIFDDSEKRQLKAKILDKSEGIFQWASLATDTVIRTRQKGDSFSVAKKNLDHVPRGLGRLYKELLEPKDEQKYELEQRTKLFLWVALATEPLTPRILQHALAFNSKMTYRFVCEYEQSDAFIAEHDFETKIKSLSHGLIRMNGSFEFGRIEFIHQSILDFLLEHGGLAILSGLPNSDPIAFGHHELSIACLKYLLVEEIHHFNPEFESDDYYYSSRDAENWIHRFPAFSYAWCNWIIHAVRGKALKNGEDDDSCGTEIMKTYCWPEDQPVIERWASIKHIFGSPLRPWVKRFMPPMFHDEMHYRDEVLAPERAETPKWPCKSARLIHLLATTGLLGQHAQRQMSSQLESPAIPSKFSVTPLGYALLGRQKKIVQNMIEAGARIQYNAGSSGPSPLYLASLWGDPAVVSLLLKSGSKVNHRESNSWTPLHIAARMGNIGAIKILIDAGANVNGQSTYPVGSCFLPPNKGQSPLHLAAWSGKMEAVRQLIDLGADLNLKSLDQKAPPLFSAISGEEDIEITEFLLDLGANIDTRDRFGNTALHAAAAARSTKILKLLLSRGADPNPRSHHGQMPIHRAAQNSPEATQVLLRAGAKVNVESRSSIDSRLYIPGLPIHGAASVGNPATVQMLIRAGSDVNAVNCYGRSPLGHILRPQLSRIIGTGIDDPICLGPVILQTQVIRLLLEAGLAPGIMRNEIYARHRNMSMVQVLELLLQAGMNPDTRDDDGETALFWLVRSRKTPESDEEQQKIRAVELLLQSGADISITNRIGRTALSYAMRNGNSRVAGILRDSGCPEGVWRQNSTFSFATKRFDELTGRLSLAFKRAGSWYSVSAQKIACLLCCRTSLVYDVIEDSASSRGVVSWSDEGLSDDGWSEEGLLDDRRSDEGPSDEQLE